MVTKVLVRPVRVVAVEVTDQRVVDRGQPVTAGKGLVHHLTFGPAYSLPALTICVPVLETVTVRVAGQEDVGLAVVCGADGQSNRRVCWFPKHFSVKYYF
jgi:hypothetical protein